MNKPRTFIFGLDGATFGLIEPLVQKGFLPTLGKLMANGVYGPLQTFPIMNSEAGWTSLITGCNPGQHGIYQLERWGHGDQVWGKATRADVKKDPFWRLLSESGQYVGIINAPLSYPADPINGFMLSGMHTPSVHSPGAIYPPAIYNELRRQGIDYIIEIPRLADLCHRNPQKALEEAQNLLNLHSRAILYLMKTRPWNVVFAIFTVTDILQHFFWPDEQTSVESEHWAPIRNIYQLIDTILHDVLELAGENTTVLIVSDHGFAPAHLGKECLNQVFAQLGLLRFCQGQGQWKNRFLKHLLQHGREIIPDWLQAYMVRTFPRLYGHTLQESKFSGIDWSHTQVFSHPYGMSVYLNLKGRRKKGIVPTENEESLCQRVQEILLNLSDPATGREVIRKVYRRKDLYHGPYLGQAADLLIEWNEKTLRDSLCYCVAGNPLTAQPFKRSMNDRRVKGLHNPQGIFITCGPNIKKRAKIVSAHLYDIAPTILYLQNHPIPNDMDGKVLTDILNDEYYHQHPVKYIGPQKIQ
jgi:predicted AlkP superfamily phosphohydrolase/phosphomutase